MDSEAFFADPREQFRTLTDFLGLAPWLPAPLRPAQRSAQQADARGRPGSSSTITSARSTTISPTCSAGGRTGRRRRRPRSNTESRTRMLALRAIDAMVTARPAPAAARGARWRERLQLRPGWPLTATPRRLPAVVGTRASPASSRSSAPASWWPNSPATGSCAYAARFGLLLLFLAWVLIGGLLLQVNAVGAEPGSSSTRYLTFAYRLAWYLTAIIALVYVYNRRTVLSTQRIVRAFAAMFVTVVVGGVLGTVAYSLNFPSVLELLLPHSVSHLPFVHDLVHPTLAQIYTDQGYVNPRASAPFAYTNDWGLNFTCLLPFFLLGWLGRDAGWRRRFAPLVLVVAAYPVVMTQNRGAWITLALLALLYAARELVFGRLRALAAIGLLARGDRGRAAGDPARLDHQPAAQRPDEQPGAHPAWASGR